MKRYITLLASVLLVISSYAQCCYNNMDSGFRGFPSACNNVNCLNVINNSLYAGIYRWDGAHWVGLDGNPNTGSIVPNGLVYYNNQFVYTSLYNISKWDSVNQTGQYIGYPTNIYDVYSNFNHHINAITVYNGEVYVGGKFDSINGVACHNIARWNGTRWASVPGFPDSARSTNTGFTEIKCLKVINNKLYAGGRFYSFTATDTFCNAAYFDGATWHPVGDFRERYTYLSSDDITDFMEHLGMIYASTSNLKLYYLRQNKWSYIQMQYRIKAMAEYNGELIVGGFGNASCTAIDSITASGIEYSRTFSFDLTAPLQNGSDAGTISCMAVYGNSLIVGGCFNSVGYATGGGFNSILQYTKGTNGTNDLSQAGKMSISPNPVSDILTIHYFPVGTNVSVMNALGQSVMTLKVEHELQTIDVRALPSGLYFIDHIKFVKQ